MKTSRQGTKQSNKRQKTYQTKQKSPLGQLVRLHDYVTASVPLPIVLSGLVADYCTDQNENEEWWFPMIFTDEKIACPIRLLRVLVERHHMRLQHVRSAVATTDENTCETDEWFGRMNESRFHIHKPQKSNLGWTSHCPTDNSDEPQDHMTLFANSVTIGYYCDCAGPRSLGVRCQMDMPGVDEILVILVNRGNSKFQRHVQVISLWHGFIALPDSMLNCDCHSDGSIEVRIFDVV